jgi:hypothetical protein
VQALQLTIICCLEALTGAWDRSDDGFIDLIDMAESALVRAGYACEHHDYGDTGGRELAHLYSEARILRDSAATVMTQQSGVYDHAYDIAFSLRSCSADGSDVKARDIRSAIIERVASLTDDELHEATGAPFDSYQIQ